jgi:site-specific DNA-methyltransferase (adenine-specific)
MCIYAVKGHPLIRGKRITDVWNFPRVSGKALVHQNQKPLALIEQIIEKSSDQGAVVLDPFMGSGTTGVACKNLNRAFIGIEKDETYFKIAEERIYGTSGNV